MTFSARLPLALAAIACCAGSLPAAAQSVVTLGVSFTTPSGVALDSNGNVFVVDQNTNTVQEVTAAGAYVTAIPLGSGFDFPQGIAVDGAGNVFVADTLNSAVKEITVASGYKTVNSLGSGFSFPQGVAVDAAGDVFVADTGNNAVKEIPAGGGTVTTLSAGFNTPSAVAVDKSGNVFVAVQGSNEVEEILAGGGVVPIGNGFESPAGVAVDANGNVFVAAQGGNEVDEVLAAGGFTTVNTVGSGFNSPEGVAIDAAGDVFVADTGNKVIKEFVPGTLPLLASVLPGSRSVQTGAPATIFATIINTGTAALSNCRVALAALPPAGLTLSYQTTNAATNALSGTANTPVTIAGNNGSQSFVVSFQGKDAFEQVGLPIDFSCSSAPPAASVTGVDTVDLAFSGTPTADIIALSATATNNGIVDVPEGKTGAFAVASTNLGATTPITVSVDTGTASLPVTATICQTSATGQCQAAPTPSLSVNFAGGATPTFSIFLQSNGTIALAPATARIFVRFEDANGGVHGSTSVAIESN
jgi:sugar lactone lactonase YvrE